ncbi:hypothetical protein [Marinisporobacter balticus]|uniref:DUF4129 domain-containing protein n=1 Tax=Marinisporobacter balticus TaxID=2018667 RepID=A0A4R2KU11_9FIRM|nr:hypothetical protein [Marinisporobacter balticus]TCO74589.1 hypothetical protein EV214_11268 [Marinisporobacter balticus]
MRLPKGTFDGTINQIIDSAKYLHLKGNKNLFQIFLEKLSNLLNKPFTKETSHSTFSTNTTQNTFILLLILSLAALIFYLMKQNSHGSIMHSKIIYGETIDEETTYDGLYKKAIQCEEEKNYKDAVRLHFISILIVMNEKSLCFLDDSKTNYEMLKVLKNKKFKGMHIFKSIGDYFQYIWYGDKQIHQEQFSCYKDQITNLVMEVHHYHEKT